MLTVDNTASVTGTEYVDKQAAAAAVDRQQRNQPTVHIYM